MRIRDNIAKIKKEIKSTGREVRLIAVTKKAAAEQIREAIDSGITAIGENRVQDAIKKFKNIPAVEKHFIGHLQTNKAKLAVQFFDVIQSVDTLKLAKEIDKRARDLGKVMQVMIQVNVGDEKKYGVAAEDAEEFYNKLLKLVHIKVVGLMTIAPYVDVDETRPYFRKLAELNNKLSLPHLSMGMSDDYMVAIEEGATMIRVGTAIFS